MLAWAGVGMGSDCLRHWVSWGAGHGIVQNTLNT